MKEKKLPPFEIRRQVCEDERDNPLGNLLVKHGLGYTSETDTARTMRVVTIVNAIIDIPEGADADYVKQLINGARNFGIDEWTNPIFFLTMSHINGRLN